jgi:hypothetical protein
MVQLLKIPEYRFELLTGLIASAGGLTESLVRIYYFMKGIYLIILFRFVILVLV